MAEPGEFCFSVSVLVQKVLQPLPRSSSSSNSNSNSSSTQLLLEVRYCARSFTCTVIAEVYKATNEVTALCPVCRYKNWRKKSCVAFLWGARPRCELHSLFQSPCVGVLCPQATLPPTSPPPQVRISLPRYDLLGEERWLISQRRRAKSLFLNGLLLGSICTGIEVKLINHCQAVMIKQWITYKELWGLILSQGQLAKEL